MRVLRRMFHFIPSDLCIYVILCGTDTNEYNEMGLLALTENDDLHFI